MDKMHELAKQVRGQLFMNPGVYKAHHMLVLEYTSSPELLVDMVQPPASTAPFIAHNAENSTSSTQLVPEMTTATDSDDAESLIATLQNCDPDAMPESEMRSLVLKHINYVIDEV